jgi:hypothetical protein
MHELDFFTPHLIYNRRLLSRLACLRYTTLVRSTWQPDITTGKLEDVLTAGTTFLWKPQELNITPQLHTVEPTHRIGWTGTEPGIYAIHNRKFEARGNSTPTITEESFSGWLTRLMKFFDPLFWKNPWRPHCSS